MNYQQLLNEITPEIYERLKRALELSKWPDGKRLTQSQRESCMQAIIAYEDQNINSGERSGFIDRGAKKQGDQCDSVNDDKGTRIPMRPDV